MCNLLLFQSSFMWFMIFFLLYSLSFLLHFDFIPCLFASSISYTFVESMSTLYEETFVMISNFSTIEDNDLLIDLHFWGSSIIKFVFEFVLKLQQSFFITALQFLSLQIKNKFLLDLPYLFRQFAGFLSDKSFFLFMSINIYILHKFKWCIYQYAKFDWFYG